MGQQGAMRVGAPGVLGPARAVDSRRYSHRLLQRPSLKKCEIMGGGLPIALNPSMRPRYRSLDGRTAQPVSPHNANTFNGHMGLFEPLLDLLVVEADPLPRTGAASGVATKWLSRPEASELAMIGTGKQAITQVSAVVAGLALRL